LAEFHQTDKRESMSEWILAGRPALLVVHMQNAIVKSPSPLEALGHGKAAYEEGVVTKIQDLLTAFRARDLPVIYVCTHTPRDATFPEYGSFWAGAREARVNYMGTWDVEVIEELRPVSGEPVFYNWPFNVFEGTGLQQHLQDEGVDTVVLTGVASGMSVGTAAWALAERFYNLIVPSDTTTDGNSELHEAVMKWMMPAIGLVTSADDVIAHL
jgi:nicotinamidase-related amidase